MRSKYKTIIFDFDGVIVESAGIKTRAYAQLYKEYGLEIVSKVVEYTIKQGGLSRYEHFRYFHKNILNKDIDRVEEKQLAERFSKLVKRATINAPFVPGIIDFLEKYYGTINFYIASGTPEEELKHIIDSRDISHYFKNIYGSPLTKHAIIAKIILFSNLKKEDIIMIGDTMTDYEGAMSVGISFIGRISQDKKDLFPKEVVTIRDFEDKMISRELFQ